MLLKIVDAVLMAVIFAAYACLCLAPVLLFTNRPPLQEDREDEE